MSSQKLQEKAQEFHNFVETTLRPDLQKLAQKRSLVQQEIQEYHQLHETIVNLLENDLKSIKTKVDIGCNFFMEAVVPDTKMIIVDTGIHDVHLELSLADAQKFIQEKIAILAIRSRNLTSAMNRVTDRIDAIHQGIKELLSPDQTER